jgi:hypothetical protein
MEGMVKLNAFLRRLLKARFLVLLLIALPIGVFSLVLNDSRQFIIPVEESAKAFAAAAGPRADLGATQIGGLVIETPVPGETPRLAAAPAGVPALLPDLTPSGIRVLALAQPRDLPQQSYSPDQTIRLPSGRGLPGIQQGNPLNGGSVGTLGPSPTPTDTGGPSGIPEPESWALMLFGSAIIAQALRRKGLLGRGKLAAEA